MRFPLSLFNMAHKKSQLCALSVALIVLLVSSCKKRPDDVVTTPNQSANITLSYVTTVGNEKVEFGKMKYTNSFGNKYNITLMKYYISYFTFIKQDNTEVNLYNHKLINVADSSTCYFTASNIPNGTYKAVRFYLGVDSAHNNSGTQEGELDPSYGMIWSWRTGYIFYKHEGNYLNDTGAELPLSYHYGTSTALAMVELPLSSFTIEGKSKTIEIKLDLNQLYNQNTPINFKTNGVRHSTDFDDQPWLLDMNNNFKRAFSINSIY
ncbi:MAG: hypothetical protein EBX41_00160 [Chitinophagia bacterium]|nr:hypothetical protein [Chitinophagia bacterium]